MGTKSTSSESPDCSTTAPSRLEPPYGLADSGWRRGVRGSPGCLKTCKRPSWATKRVSKVKGKCSNQAWLSNGRVTGCMVAPRWSGGAWGSPVAPNWSPSTAFASHPHWSNPTGRPIHPPHPQGPPEPVPSQSLRSPPGGHPETCRTSAAGPTSSSKTRPTQTRQSKTDLIGVRSNRRSASDQAIRPVAESAFGVKDAPKGIPCA